MIHFGALESKQEARMVQINFSTDFERNNQQGNLYNLCSAGIGGSVLSILAVSIKVITAFNGGEL